MKFKIQVTETLQRLIEVEADSPEQAESIVQRFYRTEAIVLDSSDHVASEI